MADRTVAVLAGGLSHERDVSVRSGRRLASALRDSGFGVEEWDADAALIGKLHEQRPEAVIVALHGGEGENGAIQTLLEMAGVPFVGAGSRPCRRVWDKPTAKDAIDRAGLATPGWLALPHSTFRELGAGTVLAEVQRTLGLPLVLKPNQGGSALGVSVVRSADELPSAVVGCLAYGDTVLAEKYVDGVEVAVSVVDGPDGPRALPAVEIEPENDIYDYFSRYTAGTTTFHCPARLSPAASAAVASLAVAAHQLLGLRDVSRTDMVVDSAGVPQFLDVTVSPGLTETSLLPMAAAAEGTNLGDLYAGLVERAVRRGG